MCIFVENFLIPQSMFNEFEHHTYTIINKPKKRDNWYS